MLFPPIHDRKQEVVKDRIKIWDEYLDNLSYVEAVALYRRLVKQALQKGATQESQEQRIAMGRILWAVRTFPRMHTQFDLSQPNDTLRKYLLQNHARDTFAYDTPKIFESFNLMLGHMVNMLQSHYNWLDETFWLRTDGTTRFSHAFETLEILLKDFWICWKAEILAALAHDYLEDMNSKHDERMGTLKSVFTTDPEIGKDSLKIISALTKKELIIYITDEERNTPWFVEDNFVEQNEGQNKEILKRRRDSEYYGSMMEFDFATLAIKCADRLHALRHFNENPIGKVARKLEETKKYFIPAILGLIQKYETWDIIPYNLQYIAKLKLKLKRILYLMLSQMEKVSAVVEITNNPEGKYDINQESKVHVDWIDFTKYSLNQEQCTMMQAYEESYHSK